MTTRAPVTLALLTALGCGSTPPSPAKQKACADAHALAAKNARVRLLVYIANKTASHASELDAVLGPAGYERVGESGGAPVIDVDDEGMSKLCGSDRMAQLTPPDAYRMAPASQ